MRGNADSAISASISESRRSGRNATDATFARASLIGSKRRRKVLKEENLLPLQTAGGSL